MLNTNPSKRDIRKFGLTFLIAMPIAGLIWLGILWWASGTYNKWVVAGFSGVGVFVYALSICSYPISRYVYIVWHALGFAIEWLISYLSLFIMYYLTLLPIALLMRLVGRKPLPLQLDKNRESYWKDHEPTKDLKRYFRQY